MFVLKHLMFEIVKVMFNIKAFVRTYQGKGVVSVAIKEAVWLPSSRNDRCGGSSGSNAFHSSNMEQRHMSNVNTHD